MNLLGIVNFVFSLVVFGLISSNNAFAATTSQSSLGAVSAITRTFGPELVDCGSAGKIQRLPTGKWECRVNVVSSKPTDFLAKATSVDVKVDANCSINAASTLTGYVLTFTLVTATNGDADMCIRDAFHSNKLPTSLTSMVYVLP